MTQDEIVEMYLQVSKELCNDTEWCWAGVGEPLQMFAKLVAAKALAQRTEQEPVAWRIKVETKLRDGSVDVGYQLRNEKLSVYDEALYTHPLQRTWVGLTDEDWKEIEDMPDTFDQGVAWAQAKLKEKNT